MDTYPQRIDAALVLVCSLRDFIGFGILLGAIGFIEKAGYEVALNVRAGMVAALMRLGFAV
jgi:hypothetical protein|tara:strand:+ start:5804 stop:5986 length:183 start_codon:yes stop_codon:yes gene_type:complete